MRLIIFYKTINRQSTITLCNQRIDSLRTLSYVYITKNSKRLRHTETVNPGITLFILASLNGVYGLDLFVVGIGVVLLPTRRNRRSVPSRSSLLCVPVKSWLCFLASKFSFYVSSNGFVLIVPTNELKQQTWRIIYFTGITILGFSWNRKSFAWKEATVSNQAVSFSLWWISQGVFSCFLKPSSSLIMTSLRSWQKYVIWTFHRTWLLISLLYFRWTVTVLLFSVSNIVRIIITIYSFKYLHLSCK